MNLKSTDNTVCEFREKGNLSVKFNSDKLEIRLNQIPDWLVGIFCFFLGAVLTLGSIWSNQNLETVGRIVGLAVGLLFVYIGLKFILAPFYQIITIDRFQKSVAILKYGFIYKQLNTYPSSEIHKFYIETETDSEDNPYYRIWMILKEGETLVLGGGFESRERCQTVLETTRTLLKKKKLPPNIYK